MLAAEAAALALSEGRSGDELTAYPEAFKNSWLFEELNTARNFKPWMAKGFWIGSLMFGIDQLRALARRDRLRIEDVALCQREGRTAENRGNCERGQRAPH